MRCHGVLSDGTEYESLDLLSPDDDLVGRPLDETALRVVGVSSDENDERRWWVKAELRVRDDDDDDDGGGRRRWLVTSAGDGYEIRNAVAVLRK